jgi:preprotein translocase subunit YajC
MLDPAMATPISILAQNGAPPPVNCGEEGMAHILPLIVGLVVIFYFFMVRPQQKEQKQRKEMLGSLKKKDKVVTAGGIYGKIKSVSDNTVTVIVDENKGTTVTFSKQAVRRRLEPGEGKEEVGEETGEGVEERS